MIGLVLAIIIFNVVAFTTNKRLTKNQIVHIWVFTIAFQVLFDAYIDVEYHGYWYFDKSTSFEDLFTLTVLIPPVNIMFLNWYPFKHSILKQFVYLFVWVIAIILYELMTMLPEPWGYFHYGWWSIWHSVALDPFLLVSVLFYYKWICKIEKASLLK